MNFSKTTVKAIAGEVIRYVNFLEKNKYSVNKEDDVKRTYKDIYNLVNILESQYPFSRDEDEAWEEAMTLDWLSGAVYRYDYKAVKKYAKTIIEKMG